MYVLYDKCFFFAVNIFITFPIKTVSALQFISSVFSAVARATEMVGTQLNWTFAHKNWYFTATIHALFEQI